MKILRVLLPLMVFPLLPTSAASARELFAEIHSSLKYLEHSQVTSQGVYEPGQWPTEVTSIRLPAIFGVGRWGKAYPESTIFTSASIVDVLNGMYEKDPRWTQIPPMVQRAVEGFAPFSQRPFYNFYPRRKRNGVWVRSPRRLFLARYIQGMANIPPDADTTSVTYAALRTPAPEKVLQTFARFRDVGRKPHYYNQRVETVNTGAFMTWLMDERDPRMPRGFARPELGPRIPFGTNDVDCIVNANVLKLLTLQGRTEIAGYKESCRLLRTAVVRKAYGRCGIYYPNDYFLALKVAELKEAGATCLGRHPSLVLDYLLATQSPKGFWQNSPPLRSDRIQATVVALNALLVLGDAQNPRHRERVKQAVGYLLKHSRKDQRGHTYWRGDVFFSAVAQARYTVVWRSDAYTTALAAQALLKAQEFLR